MQTVARIILVLFAIGLVLGLATGTVDMSK